MKTHHNYVSFRFFDCIILVYDIMKTTCFFFRKKKPTSISKGADTFRWSLVLIKTPANHFKIGSDQNVHGPSQIQKDLYGVILLYQMISTNPIISQILILETSHFCARTVTRGRGHADWLRPMFNKSTENGNDMMVVHDLFFSFSYMQFSGKLKRKWT